MEKSWILIIISEHYVLIGDNLVEIEWDKKTVNKDILDIKKFIQNTICKYQDKNAIHFGYDRMFVYSYLCIDKKHWEKPEDYDTLRNDFYKFQYTMKDDRFVLFNNKCDKLLDNTYSRWEYTMFGFSSESGVVMGSDIEQYNYTKTPFNFEKTYFYILILAFYQRITLINFSHELVENDKTTIKKSNTKFSEFVNFSWFDQISNSEHGTDIWKKWQNTFELKELFDETGKEYRDYYELEITRGQEKINSLLIILYTASVVFAGLSIFSQQYDIKGTWAETAIFTGLILTALSYPIFILIRWIKVKAKKMLKRRI